MKTIILPGYSISNKEWANELQAHLADLEAVILVHQWEHWTTGKSMNTQMEVARVEALIGDEDVYVIAKSVGTRVAMRVIQNMEGSVKKLILCGIPTRGGANAAVNYAALAAYPVENVIVFQNKTDPFATYAEIAKFINTINPKVKVVERDRSDHHYPYFEDFKSFLSA